MYCAKCGKEIPDGNEKYCDDCKKNVIASIVAEEKEEVTKESNKFETKKEKTGEWKVAKEKPKKRILKSVFIFLVLIALIAIVYVSMLLNSSETGNTIGNIRNFGYATEKDGWIYYLSPNEDTTQLCIYKIRNNGKDKKQLFMNEMDIMSINVYKGYIYFIGAGIESDLDNDDLDNKIYRMKTDGTDLEILNDNEFNNACYEIYVLDDSIYYIGVNAEICKMDLNGANKTVIADNGTGYIGITNDYIIYNSSIEGSEEDDGEYEYVTYIMNRDGSDAKPIIEGKRLYSVNVEGDYIYYSDEDLVLYKSKIGSNVEETLYEGIEFYNLNTDDGYAYYLNYLDSESTMKKVCLFRVKLDGTSTSPEKIKELETTSKFIDVVGDWVFYMDNNDEAGFMNLVHKEGKKEPIEVYRLDYKSFYENMDFSDIQVDSGNGAESTDESVVNTDVVVSDTTNTVNTTKETSTTNTKK